MLNKIGDIHILICFYCNVISNRLMNQVILFYILSTCYLLLCFATYGCCHPCLFFYCCAAYEKNEISNEPFNNEDTASLYIYLSLTVILVF